MQPILILAVAGIAVAALGSGFLTNTINLDNMVQQFGVGEATITSPATQAYIDFDIDRTTYTKNGETVTRNVIDKCVIQANSGLAKGSIIICKLTDENSNVVAEGKKTLLTYLKTKVPTRVMITDFASGTPMDSDVTNVHDVILVIQGPTALQTFTP